MDQDATLITVGYAYGAADVACIRAGFDAVSLPVVIHDQATCRVQPQWAVAMGGMRIQVRRADLPEALALLTPMVDARRPTRFRPLWSAFLLAAFAVFSVPAPFGSGLYLRRMSASAPG